MVVNMSVKMEVNLVEMLELVEMMKLVMVDFGVGNGYEDGYRDDGYRDDYEDGYRDDDYRDDGYRDDGYSDNGYSDGYEDGYRDDGYEGVWYEIYERIYNKLSFCFHYCHLFGLIRLCC